MPSKATQVLNSVDRMMARKDAASVVDTQQPTGRLMSKVVKFGEAYLRVYSIGYLALALDRSTATIRRWQRMKMILPPVIHTKDGARWYLKEEIELYAQLTKQYDLQTGVSIEGSKFPEAVKIEVEKLRKTVLKTVEAKKAT